MEHVIIIIHLAMTPSVAAALSDRDTIASLVMANGALVIANGALDTAKEVIATLNAIAAQLKADLELSEKRRDELEEYYQEAEAHRESKAKLKEENAKLKEEKAKLQKEKEDHILTKAALAAINEVTDDVDGDDEELLELSDKECEYLLKEIERIRKRGAGTTAPGKVVKKRRQSAKK